ncbi:urease accessory protein UreD [Sulfuriferula sp. AH1]|uniref:urease accessory protein UreD n=1 Tax=Sulfuriferula sp. AH1 TaxID=1985873 RepID=UPI001CB983FD|nr:urease accessory protein UreD [Sulfuriferula sp. AH1]
MLIFFGILKITRGDILSCDDLAASLLPELRQIRAQVKGAGKSAGWDASLALGYELTADKTVLARRQHHGPLVVQKPLYPEGSEVCHTIVLHPPGGIAGGDTLEIRVVLDRASKALLTSPGAGKWYRSAGAQASQRLNFTLAKGSVLEWLPQETILFDGARARMDMQVELEQGAMFMGWEIVCLGRAAAGERFAHGHLRQTVRINLAGKPVWREYGDLAGGAPLLHSPAGLAGCTVMGTLIFAGKTVPVSLLGACRNIAVNDHAGEHCGVTALPDVLIARYLGHKSEAAKRYFIALWQLLRPFAAGKKASIPRIWMT